jgi:dipeptidyl aminopeptidase/acylaminoacyl peptidase
MRKAAVLVGLFSLAVSGFSQGRRFSADDLPKIVRVTDPQVSPDGKTIAFVVGRANLKDDRWDTEIDLVDVATKKIREMTHDRLGVGSPRWSPTGNRLAFLTQDADKKAQIFVLPMDGGEAVQVTHSKTPVSLFAWRPDGAGFAYAAADEEPEKKGEAKFEDAFEVGNNGYLERSRAMPVHLWMMTIGGEAKRLTSGEWSLPNLLPPNHPSSQIAFTPDGGSLLFERAETPLTGDHDTGRLNVLNVTNGAFRPVTEAAAGSEEIDPVLSPDGTQVAYGFARRGKPENETSVFVAPLAGGAGMDAASGLDRAIAGVAWLPDGKSLVVVGNDGTRSSMWVQPVGGKATRLELGGLNPAAGINVGQGGGVAFTATTADRPAELYYMAKAGDAPVQLTRLQTVTDGVALGAHETVEWKNDQFKVYGVLTYPPEYVAGKKYPMVLYIHGGPTSASLDTFTPTAQILAGQGWLVFEPNYRGSNNEGNAFETAIIKDAGAGPGRDVMAGVKMLEAKGIVDEKRIAVTGWSYGGYMTSWLIGNYPEVWCVAIAGAPVTDIVDQYTVGDSNVQRAVEYGPSPYVGDNLKSYAVQSPINYAWKVKAPTLILSDVGDWRVTVTQSYKLYHALKDNGVTVKFIAYPVPGHSPADPIRARDVWRRWTAWLAPYLNEPASKMQGGK